MGELRFTVHFTPGHTVGHVVYVLDGAVFSAPPMLFSGDLLFLGGIGELYIVKLCIFDLVEYEEISELNICCQTSILH